MTPKEKAMEIAMKFDEKGETDNAKQCALICVEEIIEQIRLLNHDSHFRTLNSYWQEVKKEIEKL